MDKLRAELESARTRKVKGGKRKRKTQSSSSSLFGEELGQGQGQGKDDEDNSGDSTVGASSLLSAEEREQINNDQLDYKIFFKDKESHNDCGYQCFDEPKDFHDDV